MIDEKKTGEDPKPASQTDAPDHPRLTPQGHGSGEVEGEDDTDPMGGVKEGQSDPAEG